MKDLFLNPQEEAPSCKGVILRARVSRYRTKRGFSYKTDLNILKKRSCSGCDSCSIFYDAISYDDQRIIGVESVEDGSLYTLAVCNLSVDWETGITDDWDIELIDIEEPMK